MMYTAKLFENRDTDYFTGYSAGDRLTLYPCGDETVAADTEEGACDYLFQKYNGDDRPNGRTQRSMSIGDVIVLQNALGLETWWKCDLVGWTLIEPIDDHCICGEPRPCPHVDEEPS